MSGLRVLLRTAPILTALLMSGVARAALSVDSATPDALTLEVGGAERTLAIAGSGLGADLAAFVTREREIIEAVAVEIVRAADEELVLRLVAGPEAAPDRYRLYLVGPEGPVEAPVRIRVASAEGLAERRIPGRPLRKDRARRPVQRPSHSIEALPSYGRYERYPKKPTPPRLELLGPLRATRHRTYDFRFRIRHFPQSHLDLGELGSMAGCVRLSRGLPGGRVARGADGSVTFSRRGYLQKGGAGECQPTLLLDGDRLTASNRVSAEPLETRTIEDTWSLASTLGFSTTVVRGGCTGVSQGPAGSFPIGVHARNGDLAIEVRSGVIGSDCVFDTGPVRLPDGVYVSSADWKVEYEGACGVTDPPRLQGVLYMHGYEGAFTGLSGYSERNLTYETYRPGTAALEGVMLGTNQPGQRSAFIVALRIHLECHPPGILMDRETLRPIRILTPSNDRFVRAVLQSVTVRKAAGVSWP